MTTVLLDSEIKLESNADHDCLACDGTGVACVACHRPNDRCECEGGCSEVGQCDECVGTGTKPAPTEEYGSPVAGEADLRDDEPMSPDGPVEESKTQLIGDHELLAEIREAEALVSTAEQRWQDAAEHAKDLKKIYETRVSDLRAAIRGAGPLFCQRSQSNPEDSNGTPKVAPVNPEGLPANDAWRSTCIDALCQFGKVEKLIELLRGKSLETLGDLADWQAKHGEFWAKEIKGLGPAKAAKVADAQAAYWQAHPECCGAAT